MLPQGGWVGCTAYVLGGWFLQKIKPLCGSILQVGTCQILILAENPRWSRVWQKCIQDKQDTFECFSGWLGNVMSGMR